MKKILLLISVAFILNCTSAKAQTWDEWFSQKSTQRKYLFQQIVALQVYLDYLKKGYNIVQKGWTTVENITNGNLNLHRDFFSSLKSVNPVIGNSAKVVDIIAFQYYIIRSMKGVYNFCATNKNFTPEEIRYIAKVHTNMLFLCDASISELLMIIRADKTEMTDDERMLRIDKIYDDMQDKRAFVKAFDSDTKQLSSQRSKEEREVEIFRKIQGVL
ncbi:MAG: hypothetical protein ING84_15040 [Cytophagales bacterium]|jgi:hypothetical protein|nr:hypothetical protein [Cytophagales bacterium]